MVAPATPAAPELSACLAEAGISPSGADRCYDRHLERQEARLGRALVATRQHLVRRERETSRPGSLAMQDNRRAPAYLDRAQAAWREFVTANCSVQAGLRWGSNSAVSRGLRSCYLDELERRIDFLESIATGEFTAP